MPLVWTTSLPRLTRRRVVALAVVLLLLVGGTWVWLARHGDKASAATTVTYRSVPASVQTIQESISTTGTIAPAAEDSLSFPVSGIVTAVKVAQGDHVTKGQLLASVDSAQAKATLAQAQATLASAQARLSDDTSAGNSATQLGADQAAVTAAQAQVSSDKSALAQESLTSPIDGVVAAVNIAAGQSVSGSGSSGSGGTGGSGSGSAGSSGSGSGSGSSGASSASTSSAQVLVISDTSWVLDTTVDGTQVGLLANGDQAQLSVGTGSATGPGSTTGFGANAGVGAAGAAGGTSGGGAGAGGTPMIYGTISSIGLIATSSSGVPSFPIVVSVTGSPAGLHAGDSATVSLIYKRLANVLTVPTTAVRSSSGGSSVLQAVGARQVQTPVTVGVSSGGLTQITKGLAEGDQVLEPQLRVNRSTTGTSGTTNRGGRFGGTGGGLGGGGLGGN